MVKRKQKDNFEDDAAIQHQTLKDALINKYWIFEYHYGGRKTYYLKVNKVIDEKELTFQCEAIIMEKDTKPIYDKKFSLKNLFLYKYKEITETQFNEIKTNIK